MSLAFDFYLMSNMLVLSYFSSVLCFIVTPLCLDMFNHTTLCQPVSDCSLLLYIMFVCFYCLHIIQAVSFHIWLIFLVSLLVTLQFCWGFCCSAFCCCVLYTVVSPLLFLPLYCQLIFN